MSDLRRLLSEATPGPWRNAVSGDILTADREWIVASVNGQDPYGSGGLSIDQDDANAALIAAAVNALPDLLAVVDAAREYLFVPVGSEVHTQREALRQALVKLENGA